ncbi:MULTISPECIES: ribose-phosphate pyrophosphokinase [Myxococcus]|uniref:Ribose-phosphate pyrophosphokinase n=2 Tax=Myxococcus TaxID=32 RepID=L7UFP4_MYXSD|nr:ribose-phosphate pyrophosphokinase [Myxococcus stipitatus]AGC46838.1 ribose-phosphate pyrophosphokinase [Myxococcus stipitatus DSM 14675]QSQ14316.1 ribose-phosphate pyrophosphokinase [Myxococcus landrumus]
MLPRDFKIFAGNSNPGLAHRICEYLKRPLGKAEVGRFSDGEIHVEIGENVRGQDVFILQSTCPPANDHLMELLIMCDALKRASAGSITAVMPYYGYARQDRKVAPRTPITAKLIADLLEVAGAERVVSMDMHAGQIQGFFNIPSDHLYGSPVFLEDLRKRFPESQELVIVSPDAGGVERARAYSKRLNTGLAIIDKRRPRPNASEVMNLIGDVSGKDAVLVDDMVDTAGTLAQAAAALKAKGARRVVAYAVHPILSGPAIQRIQDSVLEEVVFTDTVQLSPAAQACSKIRVLNTDRLFGEAIARIHRADSLSSLFV